MAVRYRDEVLQLIARLYAAVGPTFVLMDDNAHPHRADIIDDHLDSEGIARMVLPAYSPDLNPIQNLWEALGRAVSSRFPPPATLIELETALQEEWRLLNSAVVDHLIESIVRREIGSSVGRNQTTVCCGLSFREIGSRVGRNQTTVRRICDRWMQEGTTDRRGRSHPPQCTTSREDRQNVRMTVTDHSVTSPIVAQPTESVTHHSVSASTIRRRLQQSGLSAGRPLLGLPLTQNHRVSAANGAMKEGCGRHNGMKVSLLTSHASVCNTTMVGFESGDTVERGC
ncbi:transposable element Tcb1 transposase [Trichonephila clavipes]|nr:transposable element Tcb1 transposase [Trichonephila clavipes]